MKAYLELEMPKSCSECEFFSNKLGYPMCSRIRLDDEIFLLGDNLHNVRAPQCPLQPVKPLLEAFFAVERLINNIYEEHSEWMGDSPSTILKSTIEEQKERDMNIIYDALVNFKQALGGKDE